MELAMENRDRAECTYMELVIDAYVHVRYRERGSEDLLAGRFREREPLATEEQTEDESVD